MRRTETIMYSPYHLLREQVRSLTPQDIKGGTRRFLPKPNEIPSEFWNRNKYTNMIESMIKVHNLRKNAHERVQALQDLTNTEFAPHGIYSMQEVENFIIAHLLGLNDGSVPYGQRIAGVGLMLSKMGTINKTPDDHAAIAFIPTDKERAAITRMAKANNLTEMAVLRNALRLYEAVDIGAMKVNNMWEDKIA